MIALIKILAYLSICFLILQDCTILIGSQMLYIAPIFIIVSIFCIFFTNYKKFFNITIRLYNLTPFKYLVFFILYLMLTSFFHGGIGTGFKIIIRTLLIYGLTVTTTTIFAVFFFPRIVSYTKLLKIYIFSSLSILLYGVLDFFCRTILHTLPPLRNILCSRNFFKQFLMENIVGSSGNILERASSIFFEPSFFATFIFLFLPLAYVLFKSRVKIINNNNFDMIFKISLIMLFWICLLFTKSPIYLILCLIYTSIFFVKDVILIIKKHIISLVVVFFISTFVLFLSAIMTDNIGNLNNKVFSRIGAVCQALGSIDKLIEKEPSLATRVISTVNTFQAFKKVPVFGCGYGNAFDNMMQQYLTTSIPLTKEIIDRNILTGKTGPSPNIFWSMLLQTGIIGTSLMYIYFIKTIYDAQKIKKYFTKKLRILLDSLIFVAINYIVISFYWSFDTYPMMWFIFGILNSYILFYKTQRKKVLSYTKTLAISTKEEV